MTQQEAVEKEDRPRGIIEVGDTLQGKGSAPYTICSVERGRCGLLCSGKTINGIPGWEFLPYELPLEPKRRYDYHGWRHWGYSTLNGRLKIMAVNFHRAKGLRPISEYDSHWEETAKDWPPEMQCRPTPYRVD